jgi:hypothetical protein
MDFYGYSSLCIAISSFLAADTTVFAACTVTQTCGNNPSVSCAGDDGTCTSGVSGGGYVRCDNGNTRTTCYCGSGCRDTKIGGGGMEEPEDPPES